MRCGFTRTPFRVTRRTWIDPVGSVQTATGATAEAARFSVRSRALGVLSCVNSFLDGVTVSVSGGASVPEGEWQETATRSSGPANIRTPGYIVSIAAVAFE